ncbi:cytosolic sulfotransferase 5-like [Mangifera indica]|uniref:cytosolic sulfotransferase 5-like n=1 Tax=Mangifera indica TaxID=29780 RepID=UPI001CFAC7C6|nr:cytosolic sulfotransferase 5-like [Mangifera indica]
MMHISESDSYLLIPAFQKVSMETSAAIGELSNEIQQLLLNLPREKTLDGNPLCQYQGFWAQSKFIPAIISFQRHFQAEDGDIILTSFPKSGTTWLKALAFTIVNRARFPLQNSPLLTTNPHQLVPFLEVDLYWKNQSPNLEDIPKPRILATHLPYASLPNSILNSGCRIVYVARNPLDQFISHWKFFSSLQDPNMNLVSMEEAFEKICNGVHSYGPVWEHVMGYWKASQENPEKVLFLKYEDMQENIIFNIKNLANFLGCAFSQAEERQGVVKEISKICSFDNLKNLEVNKVGKYSKFGFYAVRNEAFFRKGTVGDWRNYLTSSMSDRLEKILEEKLYSSGLSFKK